MLHFLFKQLMPLFLFVPILFSCSHQVHASKAKDELYFTWSEPPAEQQVAPATPAPASAPAAQAEAQAAANSSAAAHDEQPAVAEADPAEATTN